MHHMHFVISIHADKLQICADSNPIQTYQMLALILNALDENVCLRMQK